MNRRTTLAIVALVLAVPLFAYPLVSPPPNPTDVLVHNVNPTLGSGPAPGGVSMNTAIAVPGNNRSETATRETVAKRRTRTSGDRNFSTAFDGLQRNARHTIAYENLSEDGKRVLDAAVRNDSGFYEVPVGEGAPKDFAYNDSRTTFVTRQNTTYMVYAYRQSRTPSASAFAPRLVALLLSIVLAGAGGYELLLNR